MPQNIIPGLTFVPQADRAHPWVVLSTPMPHDPRVLVVNWTTLRESCVDDTCFLDVGDHPLIDHRSTMAYSRAKLWDSTKIAFAIDQGAISAVASVSATLLARIIAGAKRSRELSAEYRSYIEPH
jgi:hypothetical protein